MLNFTQWLWNMKTIIEQYIQFAIDNWFVIEENYWDEPHIFYTIESIMQYNIIEIITSKPFIEAIVRWIMEEWMDKNFYYTYCNWFYVLDLWDEFTKYQSLAIRDCNLEEFITNLWIIWMN
jgi:hypothetical protein